MSVEPPAAEGAALAIDDAAKPEFRVVARGKSRRGIRLERIFWQTAKTTRKTRPGMRLPTRRSAAGVLSIVVDTRE